MKAQYQWMRAWQRFGTPLGAMAGTAVLLWAALAAGIPAALAGTGDWPTYQFDNARTGFNSDETTLSPSNVANLKVHWTLTASGNPNTISAQPMVANGTIYCGSWNGNETATTLSGGKIWSTNLGQTSDSGCNPPVVGVASTPTVPEYGTSNVYVGGG